MLDMVEFGVSNLRALESFKNVTKKREGAKPCLFFAGEGWELDTKWSRIKNLLIGEWRGARGQDDTVVGRMTVVGRGGGSLKPVMSWSLPLHHQTCSEART